MGQDDVENYMNRRHRLEERKLQETSEQLGKSHDSRDEREWVKLDNYERYIEGWSDSTIQNLVAYLRAGRPPIWIDDEGRMRARCPVCKEEKASMGMSLHMKTQHDCKFAFASAEVVPLEPDESESVPQTRDRPNDIFDKLRQLKRDFPEVFRQLTGEQLKAMITEGDPE